ncbi:MAG: phosphotransferase family protein [Polaromonas sp.]|nr:phosphotransferase family protein [Polaromonas sp.]
MDGQVLTQQAELAKGGLVSSAERVVAGLQAMIMDAIPTAHNFAFTGVKRYAGGLSRENWSLDATWVDATGAQSRQLMLMRDASGTLLDTDRKREFAVLKALEATPVPAPKAHWIDHDGHWLGAPSLVMNRMPGRCEYMVLNGTWPLDARLKLARSFTELMANIHAVDWRANGLGAVLDVPTDSPSRVELAHWDAEYRRVQLEPHPELDCILVWLGLNAPKAQAIVLVHGDFKPGNALIEGEHISAKLDWETAHLGDPLEDLGWVTNSVRKREHQIAGVWEREQIVATYSALTGRRVNEAALRWWNVFSCWKLAVIQLTAVSEFVAGRYDRVFQTPSWLYRPMFQMMESPA